MTLNPRTAWAAIRDFGALQHLVPGFVVDGHLDGDMRIVTFADGAVIGRQHARELRSPNGTQSPAPNGRNHQKVYRDHSAQR